MEKLSLGLVTGAATASPFTRMLSSVSGQLKAPGSPASNIGNRQVKLNHWACAKDDLWQALERASRTGFPEAYRPIVRYTAEGPAMAPSSSQRSSACISSSSIAASRACRAAARWASRW